ncbi:MULTISPECIES: AraC family transcriptional regulator [unclassified Rhizobium]|uniref:AraC family transcriptional regulator n=1 Tax=unclassified Rhizobium TaxID=2613769 RepID=UPI00146B3CF5|nr:MULTISPECIES: AraC family transcriptional regulator [unclassified Rhizobium]MBD9450419.1 helix-turn-helix transcriptional regulator [Rhizobium sp. RHZ02]NMN74015.1 AraC family transcriptional regulator [Rhizobium sp. 57MFTsu3.2]
MKREAHVDPVIGNPLRMQRGEPLAQTLSTVRVTGVLSSNIAVGPGRWATSIPHPEACIILYIITEGHCVGGTLDPRYLIELKRGDALLLSTPVRCLLAKEDDIPPVPLESLLREQLKGLDDVESKWKFLFSSPFFHARADTGEISTGITALRMFFDPASPAPVLQSLPPVVHLREFVQRNDTFVSAILPQIAAFGAEGLSGQVTAVRLAEAFLVKVLIEALSDGKHAVPGLHRALRDPYLSKIVGAVQADLCGDWTLEQMSSLVGLSRSALAQRFRHLVDAAPAQFVTLVRMTRAADLLHHGLLPLASIAEMTGYGSEAAFSRAFHRWSGSPPGAFRRSAWGINLDV